MREYVEASRAEGLKVVSRFKALVRADGRDVGKGVLMTFVAAVAIFAFMALVAKLVCG